MLTPDQERVQLLLRETILMLCKNGLHFESQFRIDALIGITLDDREVFLVTMKELIGHDETFVRTPKTGVYGDRQHVLDRRCLLKEPNSVHSNGDPQEQNIAKVTQCASVDQSSRPATLSKTGENPSQTLEKHSPADRVPSFSNSTTAETLDCIETCGPEVPLMTVISGESDLSYSERRVERVENIALASKEFYPNSQTVASGVAVAAAGTAAGQKNSLDSVGNNGNMISSNDASVDVRASNIHSKDSPSSDTQNAADDEDQVMFVKQEPGLSENQQEKLPTSGQQSTQFSFRNYAPSTDDEDPVVFVKQEPGVSCANQQEKLPTSGPHNTQFAYRNYVPGMPVIDSASLHSVMAAGLHIPQFNQFRYINAMPSSQTASSSNCMNGAAWDGGHTMCAELKVKESPFAVGSYQGMNADDSMSDISSNQDDSWCSKLGIVGTSGSDTACGLRRSRSCFSQYQLNRLEEVFKHSHYISPETRLQLVQELNLQENIIIVWFQNRRQKWKKQLLRDKSRRQMQMPSFRS